MSARHKMYDRAARVAREETLELGEPISSSRLSNQIDVALGEVQSLLSRMPRANNYTKRSEYEGWLDKIQTAFDAAKKVVAKVKE